LIIDPQNDFVSPHGSLSVAGAKEDASRLARFMESARDQLSSIVISLDSHQRVDISHPLWFVDDQGRSPDPFTVITSEALRARRWSARGGRQERTLHYLEELERRGRYPHVIWPEHCLIGSDGHGVYPLIQEQALAWAARHADHGGQVRFVSKGESPWTEHFSAVEAEVPDDSDPHTLPNHDLIAQLLLAEVVYVAGWARSHCVGNTVRDLIRYGGATLAKRLVLLSDTMSDVPGFEEVGEAFTREVLARGVRVQDCAQALSMS
jgi:nicotinamidase-related amidase